MLGSVYEAGWKEVSKKIFEKTDSRDPVVVRYAVRVDFGIS